MGIGNEQETLRGQPMCDDDAHSSQVLAILQSGGVRVRAVGVLGKLRNTATWKRRRDFAGK